MQRRILLIDDDELILLALGELISTEGYEVVTSSRGRDGLVQAQETDFDLVITDIIMPGMQGFEVCRRLRDLEHYHSTPIIMLTAKSGDEDRRKGMAAGADHFLPKPIDPSDLLDLIAKTLSRESAGS